MTRIRYKKEGELLTAKVPYQGRYLVIYIQTNTNTYSIVNGDELYVFRDTTSVRKCKYQIRKKLKELGVNLYDEVRDKSGTSR